MIRELGKIRVKAGGGMGEHSATLQRGLELASQYLKIKAAEESAGIRRGGVCSKPGYATHCHGDLDSVTSCQV